MRSMADVLEGIDAQLVDIYASRTGLDSAELSDMMAAETWFNAESAVNLRFADSIGATLKIAAHANADRFHNIPAALKAQAAPNSNSGPSDVPNATPAAAVPVSQPSRKDNTMNIMETLKARASEHQIAAANIRTKANAEARDLTNAEREVLQSHLDAFDAVQGDIELQARLESAETFLNSSAGRDTQRAGLQNTVLRTPQEKNKHGFANLGDFAKSVRNVVARGEVDPRLISNAATTYGSEGNGADGGFAVPPDYKNEIMSLVMGEESILARCDATPTNSNQVTVTTDETTAWQTSGGVLTYWGGEAATYSQSKPALKEVSVRLHKLYSFVPVSDELLDDAPALGRLLTTKAGEKMDFAITDAIINGTGAGQPLGILNSGALISVTAESGQAAATVRTENILKMWARTPIRARKSLVWIINQDIEPQLYPLTLGSGTAVSLLYTPPGVNGNAGPYGLLMGRPVIPIEYAATLGTVGDLILFDPQSYVMIDKNGLAQASSMHVRFLYEEMTFRFTFRVDGQPVWKQAMTPYKGTNTISPYVALATRA
jgi:HK97 family phage major capsid protein